MLSSFLYTLPTACMVVPHLVKYLHSAVIFRGWHTHHQFHFLLSSASSSTTPSHHRLVCSHYVHQPPLWSSTFPFGWELHQHPSPDIPNITPPHVSRSALFRLSNFVCEPFSLDCSSSKVIQVLSLLVTPSSAI